MPPGVEIGLTIILAIFTMMAHVVGFLLWQQIRTGKEEFNGLNARFEDWRTNSNLAHARGDIEIATMKATINERQTAIGRTGAIVEEIQRNYVSKEDLRRAVEELKRETRESGGRTSWKRETNQ